MNARHFHLLLTLIFVTSTAFAMGCDQKSTPTKDKTSDSEDEGDDDDDDDDKSKKSKKKKKDGDGDGDDKPAADGVTFSVRDTKAGDTRHAVSAKKMAMTIDVGGKKMEMHDNEETEKKEKVLAVTDGAITKLQVTYVKAFQDEEKDGKQKKGAKAIEGKTYIVEKKGDDVVVTDDKEGSVPKAEADLVMDDYKDLGENDPFKKGMPKRALKKGERVPELEAALQVYFLTRTMDKESKGEEDKVKFDNVKITFREKKGDIGIFDLEMELKGGEEGVMNMSVPFKGVLKIHVDSTWPADIQMAGKVNITAAEGATGPLADMKGSGDMEMTYNYKY